MAFYRLLIVAALIAACSAIALNDEIVPEDNEFISVDKSAGDQTTTADQSAQQVAENEAETNEPMPQGEVPLGDEGLDHGATEPAPLNTNFVDTKAMFGGSYNPTSMHDSMMNSINSALAAERAAAEHAAKVAVEGSVEQPRPMYDTVYHHNRRRRTLPHWLKRDFIHWVRGGNQATCDDTCAALKDWAGRVMRCDKGYMEALVTADLVTAAFAEAGYTCNNVIGHRDYPGAPFSRVDHSSRRRGVRHTYNVGEDCMFVTPGTRHSKAGNVVSNANKYYGNYPLCACV